MPTRTSRFFCAVAITCCWGTAHLHGEMITFGFTGRVTYFEDRNSRLGTTISVGDTFSGTYSFDSGVQDAESGDPLHGVYPRALATITGQVKGTPFLGDRGDYDGARVDIRDAGGLYSTYDSYYASGMTAMQGIPLIFEIQVGGPTDSFTGDQLSTVPPPITAATTKRFSLYTQANGVVDIQGQLDSLYLVPEPASALLVGIPAVFLLNPARRRRHAP